MGAVSSAVEHHLDMVGATGSIPVPRTIYFTTRNFDGIANLTGSRSK